jgi:hypothetical protein
MSRRPAEHQIVVGTGGGLAIGVVLAVVMVLETEKVITRPIDIERELSTLEYWEEAWHELSTRS